MLPMYTRYVHSIIRIMVLLLARSARGRSQEPVTCEAGQFAAGKTASVTCDFHRQMKDSPYHIFVLRYPFHISANFMGTDILKCSRLDHKQPLCDVSIGYRFSGNISDRLTVTIPEVKEDHVGQYVCQVVPADDMPINVCSLTLNGTVSLATTAVPSQSITEQNTLPQTGTVTIATTAVPSQSDIDGKSQRETEFIFSIESHVYVIIIFLVVVSIILCVILAVLMLKMKGDLIRYRKKNKKRHKNTTRSDADSDSASMVSTPFIKHEGE